MKSTDSKTSRPESLYGEIRGEDAAALVPETQDLTTLDDEDQPREPAAPGKRPKTQWEILQLCDVPDHEIPKFCDPQYWLQYFPPLAMEHLKYF